MNFITFAGAYSLYPYAMFEHREGLAIGNASAHNTDVYTKYDARGWKIYADLENCSESDSIFFAGKTRRILDSRTWVIPFEISDLAMRPARTPYTPSIMWDPALPNSWVLPKTLPLEMNFAVVRYPVLEHTYLAGNDRLLFRIRLALARICQEYDLIDCMV